MGPKKHQTPLSIICHYIITKARVQQILVLLQMYLSGGTVSQLQPLGEQDSFLAPIYSMHSSLLWENSCGRNQQETFCNKIIRESEREGEGVMTARIENEKENFTKNC